MEKLKRKKKIPNKRGRERDGSRKRDIELKPTARENIAVGASHTESLMLFLYCFFICFALLWVGGKLFLVLKKERDNKTAGYKINI